MLLIAKGYSHLVHQTCSLTSKNRTSVFAKFLWVFFLIPSLSLLAEANENLAAPGFDLTQLQDVAVCGDGDLLISTVTTDPNPLTYLWEIDMGGGFTATGQVGSDFSIDGIDCIYDGALLRVTVNYLLLADGNCPVTTAPITLNVNCAGTVGCYNNINMALDPGCHAVVSANMLVSNFISEDSYTLSFTDPDGNTFSDPDLGAYLGQSLIYHVQDACGQGCWGTITIEDKTGVMLEDCIDYILTCEEYLAGNSQDLFKPFFNSNCYADEAFFTFEDDTLSVMCQNGYANAIHRTWAAKNDDGELIATCDQRINIQILDVTEVVFPTDTILEYNPSDTCAVFSDEYLHPDRIGYPIGALCPNFNWFWNDTEFFACGASRKILRVWTVIDWCSGDIAKGEHIVKIYDDEPAYKICPPDTVNYPAHYGCMSEINLDPLNLDHGIGKVTNLIECSNLNVIVEYIPAEPGTTQPLEGGTYSSFGIEEELNGTFTLPILPEGIAWVRYRFADDCLNYSPLTEASDIDPTGSCYFEVRVIDGNPPTAICEGNTVITLDEYGYGSLTATALDDHSNDQCGDVVSYEIRRQDHCYGHAEDLIYGTDVHFCCEDVGQSIWVFLRVTDQDGNSSVCEAQVTVQPGNGGGGSTTIQCPADISLQCTDNYQTYNYPAVSIGHHGNCSHAPHYYEDQSFDISNTNGCGIGYVIRTVTVTFDNGAVQTCSHHIYLEAADPLDPTDIWVQPSLTVNSCNSYNDALSPDVIGGYPEINNTSPCISITSDYDDMVVPTSYGDTHCQKIKRTWTITDWCVNNANGYGIYTYEQIINLNDYEAPVYQNQCQDATYTIPYADCGMSVIHTISVTDNCTPDNLLDVSWTIDVGADGQDSNDVSGTGKTIDTTLPVGTHVVTYTAVDACHNKKDCAFDITISGGQFGGPNAVCLTELTWTVDSYGDVEIWAVDLDYASTGGCNGNDHDLSFSFTDPSYAFTPVIYYDCGVLEDGISVSLPIQLWVTDASGQSDHCLSTLTINDVLDVCPDTGYGARNVNGKLLSEDGQAIPNIEVMLEDMTLEEMSMEMTDDEGSYAFANLGAENDYMVKPENDKNHLLGVSTLDLVKIQRHILGLESLDSPYKLIAADVNNSGSVSSVDLLHLRKLILGIYEKFPANQSWVFVSDNFEFADATQPWNYSNEAYLQALVNTNEAQNFTAIKIGDVNNSAVMSFQSNEASSSREQGMLFESRRQEFCHASRTAYPNYSRKNGRTDWNAIYLGSD